MTSFTTLATAALEAVSRGEGRTMNAVEAVDLGLDAATARKVELADGDVAVSCDPATGGFRVAVYDYEREGVHLGLVGVSQDG